MDEATFSARRDFLRLCGLAGLSLAAPLGLDAQLRAYGDELPPYDGPFYVVLNASGGWDTTYLMDPKGVDGVNRLYQDGDILTSGQHRFAPTAKHIEGGMSNEDFFEKYGDELLVLNGLDYSVNNHSPCSRYMATGKLDSLAYPTFAALVAACRGSQCPLAFLTFGNYSATGNLVPMARVPYLPTLKLIANADYVQGVSQHPYFDDFVLDRINNTLAEQHESQSAKVRLPRAARADNMLYAAQLNSKSLQRVTPHIPKSVPKGRLQQQAEISLASFKAGVCVSANLSIGQFDSHANNDKHQMRLIPEFLGGIDYLLRRAEELQIREKMVVIIQSEMGRTPNYNKGDGKDHWSIGSIMFLGAGIQGNRVIGATDTKQFLVPINSQTLQQDADKGVRVRPEHIHQALRDYAGIAEHTFSVRFPLAVPKDDQLRGFWG